MKRRIKRLAQALALLVMLSGCVEQSEAPQQSAEGQRIVCTSAAAMEICDRLQIELVGVPDTSLADIPQRYAEAEKVGSPMSPDIEILTQLRPTRILSPMSLIEDLQPKYEAAGLPYAFLNLKSVAGMYRSIQELGPLLGCEENADAMVAEYESFIQEYRASHSEKTAPRVLILMGLPGSYIVATENSYVGSLVQMAGAENVYAGTGQEFLNVNTEDMLQKDPDVILRTAHAMPESVMEMFAEEFAQNDIWHHFRAVEKGQVYDLPYALFGMSATLEYPEALETLDELFYGQPLSLSGEKTQQTG